MTTGRFHRGSPLTFLLLVFLLSVPFRVLGAVTELPEEVPIIAASILTYRDCGPDGVRTLVKRAFDYARIDRKRWYIPIPQTERPIIRTVEERGGAPASPA